MDPGRIRPSRRVLPAVIAGLSRNGHAGGALRLQSIASRLTLTSPARSFSRDALLLLVAVGFLNGSNYIFHIVISRFLGPARYGELAAILAALLVLSVPLSVLQTVVAKRVAQLKAQNRHDEISAIATGTTKALVPFACAAFLLVLLFSPLLAEVLNTRVRTAALIAPYSALSLIASAPLGVLLGRSQFRRMSAVNVAGVLVRLATGIALVWIGLGVEGALLATVAAQGSVLVLVIVALRFSRSTWRESRTHLASFRGEFLPAMLCLSGFWLFTQADILLARHYLHPVDAGVYSSAALISRGLLFVLAAITLAALPRFASVDGRGAVAYQWLKTSLLFAGLLLLVGSATLTILREPAIALTFGDPFRKAAGLVPLTAGAACFFALSHLLTYFHLAASTRAYLFLFGGVAAEAAIVATLHSTPQEMATVVLVIAVVVVLLQMHAALAASRWQPSIAREPEGEDTVGDAAPSPIADGQPLELSVVLPCHNSHLDLPETLEALIKQLGHGSSEVIVVSDGSTDETVTVARAFEGAGVRVLDCREHVGKGHALRLGLREARGRYVAFIDSDGDVDAASIGPFLELIELFDAEIVLGSKRHPLSDVRYPLSRRAMSWVYHKLVRLLFRVKVTDTQTGLKLIRHDVLQSVLPLMLEKRYAFDIELLTVAQRLGYRRIVDAPVRINYRFASTVNPVATLRILLDTVAVFYRRYVLDTYRPPSRRANGPTRPSSDTSAHLRVVFVDWRDIRNPDAGGAETWTHEVAKRWVASGHSITLLTSRFPGCRRVERVDGVEIRRVGQLRTGSFHLWLQRELARLGHCDLVIDEAKIVSLVAPLWRRTLPPTLALRHGFAAGVRTAELPVPLAVVRRWLEAPWLKWYRWPNVVTVSESSRDELRRLGMTDVSVIRAGWDDPPGLEHIPKESTPTLLFVGPLVEEKRPNQALEAFGLITEYYPEARLWIVGHGRLERRLRADLPMGAEMLGFISRSELYERMARAHCLLVTSVPDGSSVSVVEANSVGTPAVAYDVPGLRDVIEHGETGLLSPAGDPQALASAVLSLLRDPLKYRTMCRTARPWAQRLNWDLTAGRLLAIVQEEIRRAAILDGGTSLSDSAASRSAADGGHSPIERAVLPLHDFATAPANYTRHSSPEKSGPSCP